MCGLRIDSKYSADPRLPILGLGVWDPDPQCISESDVDVDVEWMYELRQSPQCPPQTYDLHSNDTIKFLVYYSTALHGRI